MLTSLNSLGFCRVAVATPPLRVADVAFNVAALKTLAAQAGAHGCRLVVFPELCLTGYTCADLFYQTALLAAVHPALTELAAVTADGGPALAVGAPLVQDGRLFNCAVVLAGGRVLGAVPKTYLPNTQEFYEERWFSSARELQNSTILAGDCAVPCGTDLLFTAAELPGCTVGVEICEDLWAVTPPSAAQAAAGATVLINLSASPETLGKEAYRRELVRSQSGRCLAAYLYASAGAGESTTDLVYAGHSLIAENGVLLNESARFEFSAQLTVADIDVERLNNERRRNNSFADAATSDTVFRRLPLHLGGDSARQLERAVARTPFVPAAVTERAQRCRDIFAIQTTALARRLDHTAARSAVIGISGGLDSTLALLVTVKSFARLGKDLHDIVAVTMPGPGTTQRTRNNAEQLAELLGVTLRTVPIGPAVSQHFADIGHDPKEHDVVFENAQARERTQILMDIANQSGGIVIGTGDLSELALGWCTYNADHMSMYGVNAGVPKTLVRYLVDWCAEAEFSAAIATILYDIAATPVSPELLPPNESGEISQKTEETVGPYELHDFFLFQVVRMQFAPRKVLFLAAQAFADDYPPAVLKHWLGIFYQRFFSQQFKRSCLPDGPKIGSVALSPRGDWRMPSDAVADLWLRELNELP
ncbi:MAG: NAD(+) synthase [Desulfuromonadales bacterium]|nr:NAD(+) synthase [Desulfuromonadales bacterium]MDT8423593.1 NAD(+) synthase [Desulfuromonadales bacterium]